MDSTFHYYFLRPIHPKRAKTIQKRGSMAWPSNKLENHLNSKMEQANSPQKHFRMLFRPLKMTRTVAFDGAWFRPSAVAWNLCQEEPVDPT